MHIDKIHQLLLNQNNLELNYIDELKKLSKNFPYCQLFTMLYLTNLNNNKDINFEEELYNNAYKIRDRKKLFFLINNNINLGFGTTNEEKISQNDEIEKQVVISNKIENISINSEIIDNDTKDKDKLLAEEKFQNEKNDELEKEYLASILTSTYKLEDENNKKNNDIDLNLKRSFSSWLSLGNKSKIKNEEDKALIPKAIEFNTDVSKNKKEIFSPIKKAKESIKDNKNIYSETLANIYVMQGNYPKAIEAFKQLMLSIPEKNIYFAKKIEELTIKYNKQ